MIDTGHAVNSAIVSGRGLPPEETLQMSCDPLTFVLVLDYTTQLIQETLDHLETQHRPEPQVRHSVTHPLNSDTNTVPPPGSHLDCIIGKRTEVVRVDQFQVFSTSPGLSLLIQGHVEPGLDLVLKSRT